MAENKRLRARVISVRRIVAQCVGTALRACIRAYQLFLSPWLGTNCRFEPTCSAYAMVAVQTHGPLRGTWLTLRRLWRCRPGGGSGYDPVPDADEVPEQERRR